MSAQDNLQPKQFKDYVLKVKWADEDMMGWGDPEGNHKIIAQHKGGKVGELQWDPGDKQIQNIEVNPKHQRKGLATAMWDHANSLSHSGMKLQHSPVRSDAGDAWAKSVGGYLPERSED